MVIFFSFGEDYGCGLAGVYIMTYLDNQRQKTETKDQNKI